MGKRYFVTLVIYDSKHDKHIYTTNGTKRVDTKEEVKELVRTALVDLISE